jgi:hypothetical protein
VQILGLTLAAAAGAGFHEHLRAALTREASFATVVVDRSAVKARVTGAPSGVPPAA